jgi:hypothetical protein
MRRDERQTDMAELIGTFFFASFRCERTKHDAIRLYNDVLSS